MTTKKVLRILFIALSICLACTWAYAAMSHNWDIPAAAKTLGDECYGWEWACWAFVTFCVSGLFS